MALTGQVMTSGTLEWHEDRTPHLAVVNKVMALLWTLMDIATEHGTATKNL